MVLFGGGGWWWGAMVLTVCLFLERYPLVVGCRPLFNQLIPEVEIKCTCLILARQHTNLIHNLAQFKTV